MAYCWITKKGSTALHLTIPKTPLPFYTPSPSQPLKTAAHPTQLVPPSPNSILSQLGRCFWACITPHHADTGTCTNLGPPCTGSQQSMLHGHFRQTTMALPTRVEPHIPAQPLSAVHASLSRSFQATMSHPLCHIHATVPRGRISSMQTPEIISQPLGKSC
jgi:hypothetical protein